MARTDEATTTTGGAVQKMMLPTLTAMVVGGMVGAGVFSLRPGSASPPGSSAR